MKKHFYLFLLLTSALIVIFGAEAYAASATIDTTNASKGIVVVSLTDFAGKTIKAQVEKGEDKYIYTLIKADTNLPLQLGTGEYKISVLIGVGGDKYKPIATEKVSASAIDEKEMYKASIPMVEYSVSKTAVPAFKKVTAGKSGDNDKVAAVYDEVVKNYSYDTGKAAAVQNDYVPVIDTVYAQKKGICYDYASLTGAALRSQGIPTKLVMGYAKEVSGYHAWNEIFLDGKWVPVDATYDSQVVKAGKEYTMKKDRSSATVVKKY